MFDTRIKPFDIPMSREKLEAARAKLAANNGVTLDGDVGWFMSHNCTVKYSFGAGILRIEVIDKPRSYPSGTVVDKIKDWFKGASKDV